MTAFDPKGDHPQVPGQPGRLRPADVRAMLSRIQREGRSARQSPADPLASAAALLPAPDPQSAADSLLEQYFDGELDTVGKAALAAHLERDAALRARCAQTRETLRLLRATPVIADRTEAILDQVDQRRRFLLRSARVRVWGVRAVLAASLAMAAGAAIWLDREYPGLIRPVPAAPLTALENAGRSDAATVASAVDATKVAVTAVAGPLLSTSQAPRTLAQSRPGSSKLALSRLNTEPVRIWRVGGDDIPSPSGAYAADFRSVATAIPDVRLLRCDWEPDGALRSHGDPGTEATTSQSSWWIRAWTQATPGYSPVAASAVRR